jgi:two-component system alkaline phosphatase synthesis response regulator PhoP
MQEIKILIVDDEADILDLLEYNLQKDGYVVVRASDGEEALKVAEKEQPNMVLLDIMMPRMDGIETCRRIKLISGMEQSYVVFLTARGEEYSEIAGFDVGGDDYITKPIKPRVRLSRLRAIFRRDSQVPDQGLEIVKAHDLEIFRDEYLVKRGKKSFTLPRKEFELLYFLASSPGKVFKRETLLEKIWGDVYVVDRTVDVHIRKLREKLGSRYIQTVKGVGYKFLTTS